MGLFVYFFPPFIRCLLQLLACFHHQLFVFFTKKQAKLFFLTLIILINLFSPVVRASHTFYNGTTTVPMDPSDCNSRKRKTSTLNTTINPEDKRKIIGDTFMKVNRHLWWITFKSKVNYPIFEVQECPRQKCLNFRGVYSSQQFVIFSPSTIFNLKSFHNLNTINQALLSTW